MQIYPAADILIKLRNLLPTAKRAIGNHKINKISTTTKKKMVFGTVDGKRKLVHLTNGSKKRVEAATQQIALR